MLLERSYKFCNVDASEHNDVLVNLTFNLLDIMKFLQAFLRCGIHKNAMARQPKKSSERESYLFFRCSFLRVVQQNGSSFFLFSFSLFLSFFKRSIVMYYTPFVNPIWQKGPEHCVAGARMPMAHQQ